MEIKVKLHSEIMDEDMYFLIDNYFNARRPTVYSGGNTKAREEFLKENSWIERNFKDHLEKIFHISSHHLKDIIWDKSFINGHFGGLKRIYEEYKYNVKEFIK